MPRLNHEKCADLLSTQAAVTSSVPGMSDSQAAVWCNDTIISRRNIPMDEHAEKIGDACGCLAKLTNAITAHEAGRTPLDEPTYEAAINLASSMGHQQSAGGKRGVQADTSTSYNTLVARLDLVVAAGIYTPADRQATLDLTQVNVRRCDLEPASVDADEYGRVPSSWRGDSRQIGWAHVQEARQILAARSQRR